MRDETVMNELPETGSLRLCTDFRDCVENVKKLFYASLFTHGLFTLLQRFGYLPLKLSAYSKETHTWISAINGAMKHVPHTCLFGYG